MTYITIHLYIYSVWLHPHCDFLFDSLLFLLSRHAGNLFGAPSSNGTRDLNGRDVQETLLKGWEYRDFIGNSWGIYGEVVGVLGIYWDDWELRAIERGA